jgi:serine O-acetyltransferase
MKFLYLDLLNYIKLSRGLENPKIMTILFTCFNYRILPLVFLRSSQYFFKFKYLKFLSYFFYALNLFLFRIEISPKVKIGGGFFMPHPQNIVCGAISIGDSCTIYQGVTLGAKVLDFNYKNNLRPIVMDGATIGTNSVIVGPIVIGSNSKIAPNSLIMQSIEDNEVVLGNRI